MGTPNYDNLNSNDTYAHQELNFYYGKTVDRERAEEILKNQPDGTFLLRDSSIKIGTYLVISSIQSGAIKHELICLNTGYGQPRAKNSLIPPAGVIDYIKYNSKLTNAFTDKDMKQFEQDEKEYKRQLKETSAQAGVDAIIEQSKNPIKKPPKEIRKHIASFLNHGGNIAPVNKATAKAVKEGTDQKREEQKTKGPSRRGSS